MCGIAGIINLNGKLYNQKDLIMKMSASLRHRGPDDEGYFFFTNKPEIAGGADTTQEIYSSQLNHCPKNHLNELSTNNAKVAFLHRRLSIIDLSPAGHQPMCSLDQKLWITFNGEIYNYLELREELKLKGYNFFSHTDTEVVLNAFKEWGKESVNRLNGMWAFAIYDTDKDELFASRDRFGVKPFYYYFKDNVFCFASEQKAIIHLPFVDTGVNPKAVYDYFLYQEIEYEQESFYKNIIELFPSHNLTLNLKSKELKLNKYYELKVNREVQKFDEKKFKVYVSEVREKLVKAVRLRLRSDVMVGNCLSGGIDSSTITGIMHHLNTTSSSNNPMFSAIFPGELIDESKWASDVVSGKKSDWYTVTPSSELLYRDLEELVNCQDVPIWSTSTYAQFSLMKLVAQKGVKVVLDGQGGDELFGGYYPHFAFYWNDWKQANGLYSTIQQLKHFAPLKRSMRHWLVEKAKASSSYSIQERLKRRNSAYPFLNADFLSSFQHLSSYAEQRNQKLNDFLAYEFCNTRLKTYLKCEDRCAMHFSVESRTPFADDVELIEQVFSIPGIYKMKDGVSKALLREAAKPFLPESVYKRKDKMGYVTPHNKWLWEIRKQIPDLLDENLNEFIDLSKLKSSLYQLKPKSNHLLKSPGGKEDSFLFKTIVFSIWLRGLRH